MKPADLPALGREELERYARHIVLPEIGGNGQRQLKAARVLVVGAGATGSALLAYLAAAGIGHITLVDDDHVSLSNLQRQILHKSDAIGSQKAKSAADSLNAINPHCRVEVVGRRFDEALAAELGPAFTAVVDCSDNFDTRKLLAHFCEEHRVAFVSGAVNRFDGTVTTLMPWTMLDDGSRAPRFADLYPSGPADGSIDPCAEFGVVGALTGVIGSLQALEVIKVVTGAGTPLVGRVLIFEGLAMRFETFSYQRQEEGEGDRL